MENIQPILNLATKGNKSAQDLLKLTYSELVLADIHLSISYEMQSLANFLGINIRNEKKSLNAIIKNSKDIDKRLCNDLGCDSLAEQFGERAETIQELLKDVVFLNNDDLLKLHSTAKIMMNNINK